jgi:flagellar hook-associated protein 1 FlgK
MSLISTLHSSATGLYTSQLRLDLTATNIAHADDPNYSRQRATAESIGYRHVGAGWVGMGVRIAEITRARDSFLDSQYRNDLADSSRFDHLASNMERLESVFDELSGVGIGSTLDEFWNGWNELATAPTDETARANLIGVAGRLASGFADIHQSLADQAASTQQEVATTVTEINSLAGRIAALNGEISTVSGTPPNSLLDERDALFDELAQLTDISVGDNSNGTITVRANGLVLVDGISANELQLRTTSDSGGLLHHVIYSDDGTQLQPRGGRLKALMEEQEEILPSLSTDLDAVAEALIDEVNSIHRRGYSADGFYTGLDFFSGDSAATIAVNPYLAEDPNRIASSASGMAGDNEIALEMAELRDRPAVGNQSIGAAYNNLVLAVGIASEDAHFSASLASSIAAQTAMQRAGVQGVNIDEEMVDLISLQNAYQASAQVVQTVDELLQSTLALVG